MQERLISFETAKLAKEKGFNIEIDTYLTNQNPDKNRVLKMRTALFNFNKLDNVFSRPTQSLLQKWLREVHDVFIEIDIWDISTGNKNDNFGRKILYKSYIKFFVKFSGFRQKQDMIQVKGNISLTDFAFENYEEALESALLEALKLI